MPKRLKVLIAVFLVFACTNAGSAILAAFRQRDPVWVARCTLAIGVAGLFVFCAWVIWRRKPGATWFPPIFVGCVAVMAKGPFLYGFFTMLAHRSSANLFAPDVQIPWIYAIVSGGVVGGPRPAGSKSRETVRRFVLPHGSLPGAWPRLRTGTGRRRSLLRGLRDFAPNSVRPFLPERACSPWRNPRPRALRDGLVAGHPWREPLQARPRHGPLDGSLLTGILTFRDPSIRRPATR